MKLALSIGVLVILGAVLGLVVLRNSAAPAPLLPAPPSDGQNTTTGAASSTETPIVPGEGFRGPTGAPHIIGPKSNPPNY